MRRCEETVVWMCEGTKPDSLEFSMKKRAQSWYRWKQASTLSCSGLRDALRLIVTLEVGENQDVNDVSRCIIVF